MTLDVVAAARRRTRRTVAVLLAVIVGAVVASYVASCNGVAESTDTSAGPSAVSTASSPSGASVANAVVLPADVTWTEVAGVALPVSATAGPIGEPPRVSWRLD